MSAFAGAGLLLLLGIALVIAGILARVHAREHSLRSILQLPYGEGDVDVAKVAAQYGTVVTGTLGLASRALAQTGSERALRGRIERADLSVRPSEFVVIAGCLGLAVGAVFTALTGYWAAIAIALLLTPPATSLLLNALAARRNRRFTAQLPDALTLISSSLAAGHTFLRAIQLMAVEADRPLADEFQRVVSEVQLGAPLVDSLERMSGRLQNRDVEWMVQAIRIQQQVGGHLTELMLTLAEFMRAREELRREVRVLTAEGRMSAWVLGLMPVALFIAVQMVNPGYLQPLLQGWGVVVLALTALSVVVGMAMILRMVKGVEL